MLYRKIVLTCVKFNVKIACERLLVSFMLVDAVVLERIKRMCSQLWSMNQTGSMRETGSMKETESMSQTESMKETKSMNQN